MARFNEFKFIGAAVSDDQTRKFMSKVYYDKEANSLVATDGRRCHIWKNSGFEHPESTYVELLTKDRMIVPVPFPDQQFPNWKKIVPEKHEMDAPIVYSFTDFDTDIPRFCVSYKIALNCKYLRDVLEGSWLVQFNRADPGKRAVQFTMGNFTAVIMPMSVD